jgi:hypothetical protein
MFLAHGIVKLEKARAHLPLVLDEDVTHLLPLGPDHRDMLGHVGPCQRRMLIRWQALGVEFLGGEDVRIEHFCKRRGILGKYISFCHPPPSGRISAHGPLSY